MIMEHFFGLQEVDLCVTLAGWLTALAEQKVSGFYFKDTLNQPNYFSQNNNNNSNNNNNDKKQQNKWKLVMDHVEGVF